MYTFGRNFRDMQWLRVPGEVVLETCEATLVLREVDAASCQRNDLRTTTIEESAPLHEQEHRVGLLRGEKHKVDKVCISERKGL